jgi:myo-inositol-1(or 4)-monophosphatase
VTDHRAFAVDLARRAGEVIRTNFQLGTSKTWKDDGTPLTVTDLMVNEMVLKNVAEFFPDHGVIGEEASTRPNDKREWVWICDPIDGTVPFSHGIPNFVFSLALTHHNEPVLGVVYDPMADRMYVAEKGKGAFLNDEPVRVSSVSEFNSLVIDLEDPTADGQDLRYALRKRGALVTTLWSAVYAGSCVAGGGIAGAVCFPTHIWDAAALAILVTEAGGKVTDLDGNPLKLVEPLPGLVVSNGDVHDALIEELQLNLAR